MVGTNTLTGLPIERLCGAPAASCLRTICTRPGCTTIVDGWNRSSTPTSIVTCCTPPTDDAVAVPVCGRELTDDWLFVHPARTDAAHASRPRQARADMQLKVPARSRRSRSVRASYQSLGQRFVPIGVPRPLPAAECQHAIEQARGEAP